ncbi:MAG: metallophosphoesterase [Bacteroidota bacterium]
MRILIAICLTILFQAHIFARIIMQPYLQAVTTSSVFVLIECDSPDTVEVKFGTSKTYNLSAKTELIATTTASPVTYIHKVKLAGLSPATNYHYQAIQGKSTSSDAAFYTAVSAGMPFRMAWMADCRTGTAIFEKISKLMIQADPMFAIYGGDLCINSEYKSWKKQFFIKDQLTFASCVPFFNSPGNHEGWKQNTKAFTENPVSASGTQDYYSFDYGDLHILCLNNEVPYKEGSPQYEFAASDLAASKQPWKIVIAHVPAYCSGGHGENKEMIAMTKAIFEPNKVDIVLTGHSHFYQHNLINGIHHLVTGSAGAPLSNPEKADYTVFQAKEYQYAVIDVSTNKLKLYIYNPAHEILDSFQLEK